MSAGLTVRQLITELGFDVDDKKLIAFERKMDDLKTVMLALPALAVTAAGALFAITKSAANAGEEIRAQAELAGLSAEEWQRYSFAAKQAEVSNEEFSTSMRFLTRNVGDAMRGSKVAQKAFTDLGVDLTDSNGKTRKTGDILADVTEAFSKIEDPTKRASLAVDLFGRGGARMGRFLSGGSEQIKKASRVVEAFGFFTGDMTKEADEAGDAFGEVVELIRGLKNELGIKLFPILKKVSEAITDWAIRNKDVIKSGIDKFVRNLIPMAKALGMAMLALGGASVVAAIMAAVKLISVLGSAFLVAWGKALLGPGLIALGIFAVLLALEDLWGWMQGKDSLLGRWLGDVDAFTARVKIMVGEVKSMLGGLHEWMAGLFTFDFDRAATGQEQFFGSDPVGAAGDALMGASSGPRAPKGKGFGAFNALMGMATPVPAMAGFPGAVASISRPSAAAAGGTQVNIYGGPMAVTVPPGTPAQQAQDITRLADDAVTRAFQREASRVVRNNSR